mmetsp:Transcript_51539/g.156654  ORF Transcript_51539/g.156654 Transcript_51539/m.156654 type:complete len:434 (-) Transcript_51539:385-1686(-)
MAMQICPSFALHCDPWGHMRNLPFCCTPNSTAPQTRNSSQARAPYCKPANWALRSKPKMQCPTPSKYSSIHGSVFSYAFFLGHQCAWLFRKERSISSSDKRVGVWSGGWLAGSRIAGEAPSPCSEGRALATVPASACRRKNASSSQSTDFSIAVTAGIRPRQRAFWARRLAANSREEKHRVESMPAWTANSFDSGFITIRRSRTSGKMSRIATAVYIVCASSSSGLALFKSESTYVSALSRTRARSRSASEVMPPTRNQMRASIREGKSSVDSRKSRKEVPPTAPRLPSSSSVHFVGDRNTTSGQVCVSVGGAPRSHSRRCAQTDDAWSWWSSVSLWDACSSSCRKPWISDAMRLALPWWHRMTTTCRSWPQLRCQYLPVPSCCRRRISENVNWMRYTDATPTTMNTVVRTRVITVLGAKSPYPTVVMDITIQ